MSIFRLAASPSSLSLVCSTIKATLMKIDIVSIFIEYFQPLRLSLVGKAIENGLVDLQVHDLRDWTSDRHRTVDDSPYGGGAGMVMRPEPWGRALDALTARKADPRLLHLSPSGRTFTQSLAHELAGEQHLIFACGRYEGIDARVVEDASRRMRVDELSIGDYVLSGGEVAAMVVIESVVRLLPGVIGNPESLTEESHAAHNEGLLEGPVYTKPPSWRGLEVPEVLLSGHHEKVAVWRREQALARTRLRRPDLLPKSELRERPPG
jgi:tRNA (guanine37-N1)-methyltransferase